MKLKATTSLIFFAVLLLISNQSKAQAINESQVPIQVQKWLYSKYPGTEMAVWSEAKSSSGEQLYKAEFIMESNKVVAVFNKDGKLAYENLIYNKNNGPNPIIDHANSNYEKFKLLELHRHTNFEYGTRHMADTNYELLIKVGKETVRIWFNESMNRHDSFETSNLAIK